MSDQQEINNKRALWQTPWGYAEGFTIAAGLFITGFFIEWATGAVPVTLPSWPFNLQIGISYLILIILTHIYYKNTALVRWLSGVPAAISSIVLFTVLTLLMGFTLQVDDGATNPSLLGIDHIKRSWPFVLSSVYLLTCLGLVTIRKTIPFKWRNIGFMANHIGLWIVIISASLGSGDLKRYYMELEEGKESSIGFTKENFTVEFPFTVKLIDFRIDEWAPKLALADIQSNNIDPKLKNNLFIIEKGAESNIAGFTFNIKEFHPSVIIDSALKVVVSKDSGAAPAALVEIKNREDKVINLGWITCGSFLVKPAFLLVDSNYFVAMTYPEPKRFSSTIEIKTKDNALHKTRIEVNKPITVKGWKLYQVSYDSNMGKYSKISVLEAIRDPWLPIVYTGIFLLIAGTLYMFWIGKRIKNTD